MTIAVGLVANTVLLVLDVPAARGARACPWRAMASGALLGAVGFEILKQLSTLLIAITENAPAFQVFGITLILLVWINYASRLILYAAAWAWTHPRAEAAAGGRARGPGRGSAAAVDRRAAAPTTTARGSRARVRSRPVRSPAPPLPR